MEQGVGYGMEQEGWDLWNMILFVSPFYRQDLILYLTVYMIPRDKYVVMLFKKFKMM